MHERDHEIPQHVVLKHKHDLIHGKLEKLLQKKKIY